MAVKSIKNHIRRNTNTENTENLANIGKCTNLYLIINLDTTSKIRRNILGKDSLRRILITKRQQAKLLPSRKKEVQMLDL